MLCLYIHCVCVRACARAHVRVCVNNYCDKTQWLTDGYQLQTNDC